MTTHPPARRRRLVTAAVRAAALLGVLVVVTACRSASSNDPTPAADQQQALEFARCMRDNGVPDYPDPDPNGQLRGPAHEKQNDPKFQAAQEKCRDLAPGAEHQRSDPATVEQMRQFARCMRANGVPDYPDPDPNGRLPAGHADRDDPKVQAGMETCRGKLPGGGEHR